MRRHLALLAACSALLGAPPVRAFTIGSGLTTGCHEAISSSAFQHFIEDVGIPESAVPVPGGRVWPRLADLFISRLSIDPGQLSPAQRFMLVSLVVGVRAPDSDGHAILNLENLRAIHSNPTPAGQYAHALRGMADDGDEGNAAALAGTRKIITDLLDEARRHVAAPDAIIRASVYLDFYGNVAVEVWAPVYYLGRAAHALQDSFSHTIRSESSNLRHIVHVMNYLDAINGNMREERDGLPHSESLDDCLHEGASLAEAAEQATVDFLTAARQQLAGGDPNAITDVLDTWLTLEPGCTLANDLCGNGYWIEQARHKTSRPYTDSVFACTLSPNSPFPSPSSSYSPLALAALALALRRRSPR